MNKITSINLTFLLLAGTLGATTSVVSSSATWPVGAAVDTGAPGTAMVTPGGDPYVLDYEGERDAKNQRPLLQSFKLPANAGTLQISDIYLYYRNIGASTDDLQILIFEIDDVFGAGTPGGSDDVTQNPPANAGNGGVPIYQATVTITPEPTGENHVLHLSVSGAPLLHARSGDAGYGFMVTNPDNDNVYPLKWKGERAPVGTTAPGSANGSNPYLPGRAYSDNDGSFEETYDFSLAIVGTTTPAPALLSIEGTGALTATLGVATGHFTDHVIEGTGDLENGPWGLIKTVEGDGTTRSESVSRPTSPYFYRVTD